MVGAYVSVSQGCVEKPFSYAVNVNATPEYLRVHDETRSAGQ